MRRTPKLLPATMALSVATSLLCMVAPARLSVQADTASVPSLIISQVKVTSANGQFVTLYNTTGNALDMSKYQLEYFNSFDLSKSTSSKLVALSGTIPPHGYFMVNDGSLQLCYQLTIDSATLGFSTTAGLVELLSFNQSSSGGPVIPVLQDYVAWSKTATTGAQTLPANAGAFLMRRPLNVQNNPQATVPGGGVWQSVQAAASNPCDLIGADAGDTAPVLPPTALLPASEPPATIIGLSSSQSITAGPSLPAADVGLTAPAITELLPNPAGTGNDATDEFLELYNPNATAFDLSGFVVQAGTTSLHKYTFPAGALLPAQAFVAYYSKDTGLNLSNGGGQVGLIDPLGRQIAGTAVYGAADDGQAWALAKGKWYWTLTPTPGKANVVRQPAPAAKASRKTSSSAKTTGTSKAAGTVATAAGAAGSALNTLPDTPIHPWTLALVAGLALLYGAYEYRRDLANCFHRLGCYFDDRRRGRTSAPWRRGH